MEVNEIRIICPKCWSDNVVINIKATPVIMFPPIGTSITKTVSVETASVKLFCEIKCYNCKYAKTYINDKEEKEDV